MNGRSKPVNLWVVVVEVDVELCLLGQAERFKHHYDNTISNMCDDQGYEDSQWVTIIH